MMKSLCLLPIMCTFGLSLPFQIRDPVRSPVVERPEEIFDRVDTDRTDTLTFDEFLHTDLPYEQLRMDEFNTLDTNHDGSISRVEYEDHYRKEKQNADDLRAEYFGQLYEEFDKNFDLKLDESEVQELLAKRYSMKPRSNFAQIFASFDKNADHGLNLDEYIRFDGELPFHQMDPLSKETSSVNMNTSTTTDETVASVVADTAVAIVDSVDETEVKPSAVQFNTPILAFKQEKLPMLKRHFMDKY